MSTIQTQIALIHTDTGLSAGSAWQRQSTESAFTTAAVHLDVADGDVTLPLGDVQVLQQVLLRLVAGSDVLVGTNGTEYPFRLSGDGDAMLLRINVENSIPVYTFLAEDSANGLITGKYIVLYEGAGTPVWAWFNTESGTGAKATGWIDFGSPGVSDQITINSDTFTMVDPPVAPAVLGPLEFSTISDLTNLINPLGYVNATHNGSRISITAEIVGYGGNSINMSTTSTNGLFLSASTFAGGSEPTVPPVAPDDTRLLPVFIDEFATDLQVAEALSNTLHEDEAFTSTFTGSQVMVRSVTYGIASAPHSGTALWSAPSVTPGDPLLGMHVQSVGSSDIVAAIAPN